MSNTELTEVEMQNLLDAMTDSICGDTGDIKQLLRRYGTGLESPEMTTYRQLIYELNSLMQPETPSPRFVNALKAELVGEDERVFASLRRFPMRAQIAAGIAAVAAGMLFISRRREGEDKGIDSVRENLEAALQ